MNKTVSKSIRSSWSCKNCSLPEDVYVRNRFLEPSSWSESLRNRLFRTETVLVGLTPPTFHRKGDWRLEIRLGIWRKVQWGCSAQISTFGTIESRTFSSWVFYDSQRAHPFSYVALPVRNKFSETSTALSRDCYQLVLKACLSFECRIFFLFAELGSSPTSSENLNMLLAPASGNVEELIVVTARSSESLFRTGNATYEKGCARWES